MLLRSLTQPLLASVLALCPALLLAQAWPAKPIKIVVTFPTGGAPDTLARIFAEKWPATLGQAVIVDNKPGAGGNIGAENVAKSPNDGYTIVMGTVGTHSINAALYGAKMPYDMVKDFVPISLVASTPNLLVVNNNLPVKSVQELIAYGKANPEKLSCGSPGIGTSVHVSCELFNTMAGIKIQHIPYKGRQFAIPDLLGGQINTMFDNMPSALPVVKEGKLRALAQSGAKRSAAAPDIPTVAEQGLPGFEATSWFALFAPANTPKEIVARLQAEVARTLKLPDVKEKLDKLGLESIGSTADELAAYQRAEITKWAKVVKDSGAKAE